MTTGRAGSTSLMKALAQCQGVGLPDAAIGCDDYELLHPRKRSQYVPHLERLTQQSIVTIKQLVEAFYGSHSHCQAAGFKSMPNRHPDYEHFIRSGQVTFITLVRRDIPSTIASFMLAMNQGTWRRRGGVPTRQWTFNPARTQRVHNNIVYLRKALSQLEAIQNPIRLVYEDLCQPEFTCPQLDAFFERRIQLDSPQPATCGESYVTNWNEFSDFVQEVWSRQDCTYELAEMR